MNLLQQCLSCGTKGLSAIAVDQTKMTNLLALVTSAIAAGYTFIYVLVFDSHIMGVLNAIFSIAYAMSIIPNRYHRQEAAKLCFASVFILHLGFLSLFTFPITSGIHFYLVLIIPCVHFIFPHNKIFRKLFFISLAAAVIFICELSPNQNPIIELSDEAAKVVFLSVVVFIFVVMTICSHLFTRNIIEREESIKLLANTDFLTKLHNRRYFNDRLKQQFSSFQRHRQIFSLVLVDIDYFKTVNDRYGHASGDEVLQQIAYFLRENSRVSDVIARIGGEEFVLILPGLGEDNAFKMAEILRQEIAKHEFKTVQSESLSITVSIGVRECDESVVSTDKLFEQTDKALYQAKESGRNAVVVF